MNYNKDFLLQLDNFPHKEKFAKITLLTKNELPIESIEGRITNGGSINIDGNSAVRRSVSLSMVSNNTNYHQYLWTMNSKFKLEIGLRNLINPTYPDIIWFPQGIFVFTSFSTSHSVNSFTISLQGKDKGCLINGEVGGSLHSSIDFGVIEEQDQDGIIWKTKREIKDIIRSIMHEYAGEPFKNIIINDLDTFGLELLEYRYKEDLFFYRSIDSSIYDNAFLKHLAPSFTYGEGPKEGEIVDFDDIDVRYLEILTDSFKDVQEVHPVVFQGKRYYLTRISYGQVAGYRGTQLVYAGDLISNVGESITSVLDKIKNMLGQYEYFYDIEGRFIFQKKQSFINTLWGNEQAEQEYGSDKTALAHQTTTAYKFNGSNLIQSFNNNPNLKNLKNDYSIWGNRKSEGGIDIPVHLRYAIDDKPIQYTSIYIEDNDPGLIEYNKKYNAIISGQKSITYITSKSYSVVNETTINCDWREVIYRMAADHFKYGSLDDFELRVIQANPTLYSTGLTGYEQYYTDILSFQRDLYFPEIFALNTQLQSTQKKIESITTEINNITKQIEDNNLKIKEYERNLQMLEELKSKFALRTPIVKIMEDLQVPQCFVQAELSTPYCSVKDQLSVPTGLYIADSEGDSSLLKLNTPIVSIKNQLNIPTDLYIEDEPEAIFSMRLKTINTRASLSVPQVSIQETIVVRQQLEIPFGLNIQSILTWQEVDSEMDKTRKEKQSACKENEKLVKQKEKQVADLLDQQEAVKEIEKQILGKNDMDYLETEGEDYGWNKNTKFSPESLNFWIDFLDVSGTMSQYSVKSVGSRAKPINDSNIKAIYFRETPSAVFVEDEEEMGKISGFRYIQVPDIDNMFAISAQGKSAKDKLDELLYQHSFTVDSVTINAVPIYYLEPNTRIHLSDPETGTEGDYIISRISLPLTYNGMMSITATKAVENII